MNRGIHVLLLSLIVLPFINLSGDARHDFLVDSITDQLTSELARIEDSFVVNRKTALAYRGDSMEVAELGLELGVVRRRRAQLYDLHQRNRH